MDIGVIPNATLWIQAILFLAFVLLMNFIYVKPYSAVIEGREELVRKNLETASRLREEAKTYVEEARGIIDKARSEANAILEEAKKEAAKVKTEILDKAEKEAQAEVEVKVKEIRESLEEEKKKLEEAVRDIANSIVKKILGEAA
ncbi:ATP synthase F0 subunit B [Hydrogenivirga sp. 128-5-R1-1]|uniref:ATP synthase F0 subunit B n=1 Tax=Hydrogenivirga sp. 128-5-R1-1 TaxID=392423 RepID=UPI00015F35E6|nr:ATP synthase F0 subunit B [Hydrogenivirga sp. 128-5-R1-1]EDP76526.1 ATP synthase F0 subunit b [Hydrogenivirga sp. 128-5-R1-1]